MLVVTRAFNFVYSPS